MSNPIWEVYEPILRKLLAQIERGLAWWSGRRG